MCGVVNGKYTYVWVYMYMYSSIQWLEYLESVSVL